MASTTNIGTVTVDPDGKIFLNGKPSNRSEVDLRIMAAQAPARRARLERQLKKLNA